MEKEIYFHEKRLLYNYLGEDIVTIFKDAKVIVAGGAITSLFCSKPINDVDFYLKDRKTVPELISDLSGKTSSMYKTKKAILFPCKKDIHLQLVYFKFFKDAQDIFNSFDFTCCMGAFDFETEQFILHEDFLKHNCQKMLKFNGKTDYPYVSLLRVRKYEEKGYKISKPEMIKIVLACSDKKLETWNDVLEQIGGMYGMNIEQFFDIQKPYSIQEVLQQIEEKTENALYFDGNIKFSELDGDMQVDILVDEILSNKKFYVKMAENRYRKISNKMELVGQFEEKDVLDCTIVDINKWAEKRLPNNIAYKFVKKTKDGYVSYYDNSFKYVIGEKTAQPKEQLYFCDKCKINEATCKNSPDAVLMECLLLDINYDTMYKHTSFLQAKYCIPIKEIPYVKEEIPEIDIFDELPF